MVNTPIQSNEDMWWMFHSSLMRICGEYHIPVNEDMQWLLYSSLTRISGEYPIPVNEDMCWMLYSSLTRICGESPFQSNKDTWLPNNLTFSYAFFHFIWLNLLQLLWYWTVRECSHITYSYFLVFLTPPHRDQNGPFLLFKNK